MMDLISRKALLESIKGVEVAWYIDGNYTTYDDSTIVDIIKEQPSVTDTNVGGNWILCSEKLPEEDKMSEYYESVIVTLDNGRVATGCYRNIDEEWWVDAEDGEKYSVEVTGHVIAWMSLPEPYKGE